MKIFIGMTDLYVGGTERALLNLLEHLDLKTHDITIGLVNNQGKMVSKIPKDVKVLLIPMDDDKRFRLSHKFPQVFKKTIKKLQFFKAFNMLVRRIFGDQLAVLLHEFDEIESLEEPYDVAISFSAQMPFISKFVALKVKAKKKLLWLHNSFLDTKYHYRNLNSYIDKYTHIIAVSRALKDEFINLFGDKHDVMVIHNLYPIDQIIELSKQPLDQELSENINLLTVGRMEYQKGFDIACKTASILKQQNINFTWYFIGDGSQTKNIMNMIKKKKLSTQCVMLGTILNPYPYMKNTDIYVQTSRHEGFCTTTMEAKILGKTVITTRVQGAEEQFNHGFDGYIVEKNPHDIARQLKEIIDNRSFAHPKHITSDFNEQQLNKLLSILE